MSPEVTDFEEPIGGEGKELVTVELAGLNPIDLALGEGIFSGGKIANPYVAGLEGVGRTDPNGPLYYFGGAVSPHGSFAPKTLVAPDELIELPEGIDPAQALVFGIAGMAGWLAISYRSDFKAGEKVIVLGGGSIVGQVAIWAAKALGADKVVAVARSESGLERGLAAGADSTVQLDGDNDSLTQRLTEAAGGPADVVVDMLWGPVAMAALNATGQGGRLIQIGNSSGEMTVPLSAGVMRGQARDIRGHTSGAVPADVRREVYLEMCRRSVAGEFSVKTEEVPLDRIAEAWDRQAASPGVKLVIRP